jgi:hypothetical protein
MDRDREKLASKREKGSCEGEDLIFPFCVEFSYNISLSCVRKRENKKQSMERRN